MFWRIILFLAFPLLSLANEAPKPPAPSALEKFFPLIILVLVLFSPIEKGKKLETPINKPFFKIGQRF